MSEPSVEKACQPEELYASVIADMLGGIRHVAVGMLSPVPGAGALLARQLSDHALRWGCCPPCPVQAPC